MTVSALSTTLKHLRVFLFGFFALIVLGTIIDLVQIEKGFLVRDFQGWREMSWSWLVIWITRLGEWPVMLLCIGAIALDKPSKMIPAGLSFIILGAIVFLMKDYLGLPRPILQMAHDISLTPVRGYDPNQYNSFPSGHTALAFSIATAFLMSYSKPIVQVLMLIYAFLVGLSRVFLMEHFLEDVMAGSILGVMIVIFFYWLYYAFYPQSGMGRKEV